MDYQIGDKVKILYNPKNHKKFYLVHGEDKIFAYIKEQICLIFGVLFMIAALLNLSEIK